MALGKAVIVTDTLATDYISNGVTGLLVEPGDPVRLRESLRTLMENPSLVAALGRAAQKVAGEFSPEFFFERVFNLVDEAVASDFRRHGASGAAV